MNGEYQQNISFAEFELDAAHRRLLRQGEPLPLYAKTFDLLAYLLEHNGQIITKDEILESVWAGQFVEEANLSVQISTLRKVLGETRDAPRFIVTVPGKGYKFVADIHNGSSEIVIEKHKFCRVVVEEKSGVPSSTSHRWLLRFVSDKQRTNVFIFIGGFTIFLALAAGSFWMFNKARIGSSASIEKQPKIKKLTYSGKVANAILSPDGRFFAYSQFDKPNWQTSIRLGQTDGGSDVILRPAADIIYRVVAFSADGSWLYFGAAQPRQLDRAALYKMPFLGGVSQKLADDVSIYSRLSPDQKQIAFVRNSKENNTSTLIIRDTDGARLREIAIRPFDKLFFSSSPAWSADGSLIAVGAANDFDTYDGVSQNCEIFTVSAVDGSLNQLTTLEWGGINRLEWLKDGSGLIVAGRDQDSGFRDSIRRELWLVNYPDGKARKIMLDLNTYTASLSLSADAKTILAVQGQSESNIWVADADNLAAARQLTFGSAGRIDGWYGLDWTPNGQIVYTALTDRSSTIWVMDADGANSRQLTPIGFWDENPVVTSDGTSIFFQSNRSGKTEIWQMGIDGSNLKQITKGDGINSQPSITPDNNWVFYMNERGGETRIWRVSLKGDEAIPVTDKESSYPRVSPDGKFIACGYEANGKTSLAVIPVDGGDPVKLFDVPKTYNFHDAIRWTQDGKFITYRDWANGIWRQSVEGGEPQRLEGLPKEKLLNYSWSRNGNQLTYTRGKEMPDAVLITDFR